MHAVNHEVEGAGLSDEREDETLDYRAGPPDRRYYPPAPRDTNWPAVFAALVTIVIALLGYSTTILNDIKRDVRATSDRQIHDSATYESERAIIRRDIDEAKNKIDTVITAFQYTFNNRLSVVELKNGIQPPKKPQQPNQLQGD